MNSAAGGGDGTISAGLVLSISSATALARALLEVEVDGDEGASVFRTALIACSLKRLAANMCDPTPAYCSVGSRYKHG
jgi:hypothetical protein